MPYSFRDALRQTGSWCEVSGTGFQKDAGHKSNGCDLPTTDLQESCADTTKSCSFLRRPIQFFRGHHSKTELIATGGSGDQKACSNSNRQVSNFPAREALMSAESGAAFPVFCVVTTRMQLPWQAVPLPPEPARERHRGLAFSSGLSLVSSNDLGLTQGSSPDVVICKRCSDSDTAQMLDTPCL